MVNKKVVIHNPPDYVEVEIYKAKRGKVPGYTKEKIRKYFTANIWYAIGQGLKNDAKIRGAAKTKASKFFTFYLKKHFPKLKKEDYPVKFTFEIHRKLGKFDLDNKAFFWAKLFKDYLVRTKKLEDDTVEFVRGEEYKYVESTESKLVIKIETILDDE